MPKVKVKTKGIPSPHHYVYPGTNTLKNKYGIKDSTVLMDVYARNVKEGRAQLREEQLPYRFDASYLCYIHKRLFFSTFEWAGQLRNVPFTFKDGTIAAMPEMMDPEWGTTFAPNDAIHKNLQRFDQTLLEKNNLQGLSREEFVKQAAPLFALLHVTRPFRVGNGYTQELFFENLARAAGHSLDFSLAKQEEINIACIKAGEEGDLKPLKSLFEHISNPEHISKKQSRTETQQKGHVSPEQWKTLKNEDEASFTTSKTGNFSGVLIPKKNLPPLAKTEVNVIVREDPNIRESREKIQSLSKLVYGKSKILDKQMMQIATNVKNPSSTGYKLSHQIKRDPKSVGKLAGINFCGLKNARRKTAEKNVKALADEIVNFSLTVRHVQREMTRDYQNEQRRCAIEIRMPTENLQDLLALPKEMQKKALKESPVLSDELDTFVKALHNRLSPDEQRAIKRENYKELATMMSLSEKKARQIANVARLAKAAHLNSETQTHAISHSKGLAIASSKI
ncbi:BID domain-containing T4SS effector [Bartonella taylorii]|uniref:BID domain-containing T4SS effector n=1 Tax=Bartonella taylorii TaxID=33046 RepID=UPI001ABBA49A|nr:BID domain-containing T4SS effector [Bartonella taylorii]